MRYIVEVYDRTNYSATPAVDFQHCVSLALEMSRAWPEKAVWAKNLDGVGADGLTPEERDAVAHAIMDGRKSSGK